MSVPPFLALPRGAGRVALATPGGPLAAVEARPDGPPRGTALLVPGLTGSKEDFVAILGPLAAAGWRVVALDQRGQYQSPGPDDTSAYGLPALASDLMAVLGTLARQQGGPVHLLGHSLGGLVARRAVLSLPDPRPVVATITLLCSGPAALPEERRGPIPLLQAVLPGMPMQAVWDAKEQLDRAAGWDPPPAPVHEFLHRRFVATNAWSLRAMADTLLTAADEVDALAATGVRVLVAHGADDDVWPLAEQAEMARRLGTVAVAVPGSAHSPAAEAPHATAALLDAVWGSGDPDHASCGAAARVSAAGRGYDAGVHVDASLEHTPAAAGIARRLVVSQLGAWGADELADDAALVASELVANAVRHARGPMGLRVVWADGVLRVEVRDADPGALPLPREPGDLSFDGRGMLVVGRLASRWGWDRDTVGKVVWAELTRPVEPVGAGHSPG